MKWTPNADSVRRFDVSHREDGLRIVAELLDGRLQFCAVTPNLPGERLPLKASDIPGAQVTADRLWPTRQSWAGFAVAEGIELADRRGPEFELPMGTPDGQWDFPFGQERVHVRTKPRNHEAVQVVSVLVRGTGHGEVDLEDVYVHGEINLLSDSAPTMVRFGSADWTLVEIGNLRRYPILHPAFHMAVSATSRATGEGVARFAISVLVRSVPDWHPRGRPAR